MRTKKEVMRRLNKQINSQRQSKTYDYVKYQLSLTIYNCKLDLL